MADDSTNNITEIAPGIPKPEIVSNPSPFASQITTTVAMFGFAITFGTALLSFFKARDVAGAVQYLQSAPAIGFMSTVVAGGLYAWRLVRRYLDKKKENKLVAAAPTAMAMTKDQVAAVQAAPTPEAAQAIVTALDAALPPTRAPETETAAPLASDRGMVP